MHITKTLNYSYLLNVIQFQFTEFSTVRITTSYNKKRHELYINKTSEDLKARRTVKE